MPGARNHRAVPGECQTPYGDRVAFQKLDTSRQKARQLICIDIYIYIYGHHLERSQGWTAYHLYHSTYVGIVFWRGPTPSNTNAWFTDHDIKKKANLKVSSLYITLPLTASFYWVNRRVYVRNLCCVYFWSLISALHDFYVLFRY